MGSYHGKTSFLTFSHPKSVMHRDYNPVVELLSKYVSVYLSVCVLLASLSHTSCFLPHDSLIACTGIVSHRQTIGRK